MKRKIGIAFLSTFLLALCYLLIIILNRLCYTANDDSALEQNITAKPSHTEKSTYAPKEGYLISSHSFRAKSGRVVSLRLENGEKYKCSFTVWAGSFGYCFSDINNRKFDEIDLAVFLSNKNENPSNHTSNHAQTPNLVPPEDYLFVYIRIDGETYLLGWIDLNEDSIFQVDFSFHINDGLFMRFNDAGLWEKIKHVSPLSSISGVLEFTRTYSGQCGIASDVLGQTGGVPISFDNYSGQITFQMVSFYVCEDGYHFDWSIESDTVECIVTPDTVLTLRNFDDDCDMLVTAEEFFRQLDIDHLYVPWDRKKPKTLEDYIACFVGIDAHGLALYIGEVPLWD